MICFCSIGNIKSTRLEIQKFIKILHPCKASSRSLSLCYSCSQLSNRIIKVDYHSCKSQRLQILQLYRSIFLTNITVRQNSILLYKSRIFYDTISDRIFESWCLFTPLNIVLLLMFFALRI